MEYGVKGLVMITTSDHELAVKKRCYGNRPARKKQSGTWHFHGVWKLTNYHKDLEKPGLSLLGFIGYCNTMILIRSRTLRL